MKMPRSNQSVTRRLTPSAKAALIRIISAPITIVSVTGKTTVLTKQSSMLKTSAPISTRMIAGRCTRSRIASTSKAP